MPRNSFLRTAARIAARDLRASPGKFIFLVFAVAVGVGALTGVRSFGRAFRTMLLEEARTLMAADLMARTFEPPGEPQMQTLSDLERQGVRVTRVTETVSMLSAGDGVTPVLVSLKSVDPAAYPFYGELVLNPPQPASTALAPDTIAVSDDLLLRLGLQCGDTVRLGTEAYRIAAVVEKEPDRMTGSLNVGPRILMSREALDRTGLIKPGSRAAQRFLFRLPDRGLTVAAARDTLKAAFPTALISDFRETHPLITRGLRRSERFLSLVSLIALIVGALGVAATMHSHLQQRMDTIAILKCIGARSGQVMRIFLAQAIGLTLAGSLLGILLGAIVQAAFPWLIARYFQISPRFLWDWRAALEGTGVALLTSLLFTAPALLGVRRVRPAVIFRRDMAEPAASWRKRLMRSPERWVAAGAILLGLAAIAAWLAGGTLAEAAKVGGYFAGGLATALLALAAVSWLLLGGLRLMLRQPGRGFPPALRQGIANIYRPGNQAQSVLVSLGIGVMFTLTVYLVQHGMLAQMTASAPPDMPNVFLINVTGREQAGVAELLRQHKGVEGRPELIPVTPARLETIDGMALDPARLTGRLRRYSGPRPVTMSAGPRQQTEAVAGQWWDAAKGKPEAGQVCVLEAAANDLNLKPRMRLEWTAGGRRIAAVVACIYRTEEVRMSGNMDFVLSPGTLDELPLQYFALVRVRPDTVATLQKASFERFPSVTVINGADVLEIIQQVVDQIALVVRFVSLFAIVAGVVILASSVAGTRFRRVKEVAILKTLGATRRKVIAIFSVEFVVLGAVAGFLGSLLASAFANLLLVRLLEAKFRFDPLPNVAAIALSALVASAAGWLASWRILGQKPLEVLRGE